MADNYIAGLEESEDETGMRFFALRIKNRNKMSLFERMRNAGLQTVSGAALAAFVWKSNFHPIWSFGFAAMAVEGAVPFYKNMLKYFRKMPRLRRERIRSTSLLATGTITYFGSVVAFSRALKQNDKLWIAYLGFAATGFYISVSSNNRLGRTVLNRRPFFKCYQLLFGPTLIGIAADYLLCLQKHEEEWLRCLPLMASALVANHISFTGYRRVESNNEPRWLLFKGLELFVGGSIVCINGAVLVAYALNNQFHPFLTLFFTSMIFNGITDIIHSLESFQECVEMEAPVFYSISGMIVGPVIFFTACLGVRYIKNPVILPAFIVISGIGLWLLGKSVMDLYDQAPEPVFNRYCQRVLGPVATVYGSLASAYIGYHMGWRFSLAILPLIPAGMYATYRGWA